nr:UDP-glucuronosyltransferase 3A1 [Vicugna pacos]
MGEQRVLLLVGFLLPGLLLSEAAKILTVSLLDGSHYFLLEQVSQILQDHGHNVTMLVNTGPILDPDLKKKGKSFQVISWFLSEDDVNELRKHFEFFVTEALHGREALVNLVRIMEHLGTRCSYLLRSDIMDSLKNENFDLMVVEAFDFCSFLIAEKLEKHFVSVLPTPFGSADIGLPSAVSHVPVHFSYLTSPLDFWGRVQNFLLSFHFSMRQWQMHSAFDKTIKEHFPEGSRPVLSHLLKKAELWFVNSDFAFEYARPLLPNTVYIGGLLAKPIKPVPQELENFITKFGDSGFVLVALGSMVNDCQPDEVLKEMNAAFARLPQGVIWNYKTSHWPKDIKLAANVKLMDWLPQNDLLGHPRIRLFVTHGGMNSVMEAIQHGVPMVGIPILEDHCAPAPCLDGLQMLSLQKYQQHKSASATWTRAQTPASSLGMGPDLSPASTWGQPVADCAHSELPEAELPWPGASQKETAMAGSHPCHCQCTLTVGLFMVDPGSPAHTPSFSPYLTPAPSGCLRAPTPVLSPWVCPLKPSFGTQSLHAPAG